VARDREHEVTQSFVALASRLAAGFDVVDLLAGLTTDCARLLDVESAGLLLANSRGVLHVVAASSEATRNLELFQIQRDEGPCLECYRAGTPVSVPDLAQEARRWPQFVAAAAEAGFGSVHALPMRLRDNVLGALGLFGKQVGQLNPEDLRLGQALADVASVSLVQDQALSDSKAVTGQLQVALNSRVVIEQAKGLLAQLGDLEMTEAFALLRRFARDHNRRLTEVGRALVSRALPAQQVIDHGRSRSDAPAARDRH
jgi:hypothetical protein